MPNVRKGFNVRVGEKLKNLRKSRGLTQPQLAEILDSNTKYISQLEGGHRGIGPDMVARYCDYFGITPEDLYSNENKKGEKLSPIAQMILDEILSMPLPDQTRLLAEIQERKERLQAQKDPEK